MSNFRYIHPSLRQAFNRFGDIAGFVGRPEPIFPYPAAIPAKIWGVPFGVDPRRWGAHREERLG